MMAANGIYRGNPRILLQVTETGYLTLMQLFRSIALIMHRIRRTSHLARCPTLSGVDNGC